MLNFKKYLLESVVDQIVYHGSDKSFRKFNPKKSIGGIIWFTSDQRKVLEKEVGAAGHGYIYELKVDLKNPAGWDEYDKYLIFQLESMGYDGAILPNGDGSFDGFVFDPNQITILKKTKV